MTGRWRTWGRWVAAGGLALLGVSAAAVTALGWNWPSTTAPRGGRTVLHNPVEISMQTYETLLEQQNLGDFHPTLVRGAKWYLPEKRKQLAADAQAELERLGLRRGGRIDVDFLDTLQLLQRPAVEYYT